MGTISGTGTAYPSGANQQTNKTKKVAKNIPCAISLKIYVLCFCFICLRLVSCVASFPELFVLGCIFDAL
jgi:hypothetical protein